jgi:hypothetical protein
VRAKLVAMAKEHGFEIRELFGKGSAGKGSSIATPRVPPIHGPAVAACHAGCRRD